VTASMAERIPTELTDDDVLLVNENLVIVNKPRGWPVHATRDPTRLHLESAVRTWMAAKAMEFDDLSVVHRLDVWTSGVVLLGRSRDARRRLARLFEARQVGKRYRAICVGGPTETEGELRHYLARQREGGRDMMRSVQSGGKVALTRFRLIARSQGRSLVELEPVTGRTHQLRVQSAEAGWPIVGDVLYGDAEANTAVNVSGQLLHACELNLIDPFTDRRLVVEAPSPLLFTDHAPSAG